MMVPLQAKEQSPLFSRYEGGWPILEIVRTSLKNERRYANQRANGTKHKKTTGSKQTRRTKRTKSTRDTPDSNTDDDSGSTSSNKDKDGNDNDNDNDNTSEPHANDATAPVNEDAAPPNDSDIELDDEEENKPVPDLDEQPFHINDDEADDGEDGENGSEEGMQEGMQDNVDEDGDPMDIDSVPRMSEKAKGKRRMVDPEDDEEEAVVEPAPKKRKSHK